MKKFYYTHNTKCQATVYTVGLRDCLTQCRKWSTISRVEKYIQCGKLNNEIERQSYRFTDPNDTDIVCWFSDNYYIQYEHCEKLLLDAIKNHSCDLNELYAGCLYLVCKGHRNEMSYDVNMLSKMKDSGISASEAGKLLANYYKVISVLNRK